MKPTFSTATIFTKFQFEEKDIQPQLTSENLLGRGKYGDVYRIITIEGKAVAAKQFQIKPFGNSLNKVGEIVYKLNTIRKLEAEKNILQYLTEAGVENVVKFVGSLITDNHYYLMTELVLGCTLTSFILDPKNLKFPCITVPIMLQIARALAFIHKTHVV